MRVCRSGFKIYIGEQENKKTENKKTTTPSTLIIFSLPLVFKKQFYRLLFL
jgi:hypothetical protein